MLSVPVRHRYPVQDAAQGVLCLSDDQEKWPGCGELHPIPGLATPMTRAPSIRHSSSNQAASMQEPGRPWKRKKLVPSESHTVRNRVFVHPEKETRRKCRCLDEYVTCDVLL